MSPRGVYSATVVPSILTPLWIIRVRQRPVARAAHGPDHRWRSHLRGARFFPRGPVQPGVSLRPATLGPSLRAGCSAVAAEWLRVCGTVPAPTGGVDRRPVVGQLRLGRVPRKPPGHGLRRLVLAAPADVERAIAFAHRYGGTAAAAALG